ncbi:F-actin-capping protein subunit beta, partial [Intoshia linei]
DTVCVDLKKIQEIYTLNCECNIICTDDDHVIRFSDIKYTIKFVSFIEMIYRCRINSNLSICQTIRSPMCQYLHKKLYHNVQRIDSLTEKLKIYNKYNTEINWLIRVVRREKCFKYGLIYIDTEGQVYTDEIVYSKSQYSLKQKNEINGFKTMDQLLDYLQTPSNAYFYKLKQCLDPNEKEKDYSTIISKVNLQISNVNGSQFIKPENLRYLTEEEKIKFAPDCPMFLNLNVLEKKSLMNSVYSSMDIYLRSNQIIIYDLNNVKFQVPVLYQYLNELPVTHVYNIERVAWVAPENYDNLLFQNNQKSMAFSFSILIWEVLSGSKPIITNKMRRSCDLNKFSPIPKEAENNQFITTLINKCCSIKRKQRPKWSEIVSLLKKALKQNKDTSRSLFNESNSSKSKECIDCCLDLLRRLPPQQIKKNAYNIAKLLQEDPDLCDDLLSAVDLPLEISKDNVSGKEYLCGDYNRDGDSYRSPWSNQYFPSLLDGVYPSTKLRELEIEFNNAISIYKNMYYDGGYSSCYLWNMNDLDTTDHFGLSWLIKKKGDNESNVFGEWNSIHIVEAKVDQQKKECSYKISTTIILSLKTTRTDWGVVNLSGSLSTKCIKKAPYDKFNNHIVNVGKYIE